MAAQGGEIVDVRIIDYTKPINQGLIARHSEDRLDVVSE
jgi:hypothetical protein